MPKDVSLVALQGRISGVMSIKCCGQTERRDWMTLEVDTFATDFLLSCTSCTTVPDHSGVAYLFFYMSFLCVFVVGWCVLTLSNNSVCHG